MTVKSYIKKYGWNVHWNGWKEGICRSFQSADIVIYYLEDGEQQRVEFRVDTWFSEQRTLNELDALFARYCEDEKIPRNTVTEVRIVMCYPCFARCVGNIPEEFMQCYTVETLYKKNGVTDMFFDALRRVKARLGKSGEGQMC